MSLFLTYTATGCNMIHIYIYIFTIKLFFLIHTKHTVIFLIQLNLTLLVFPTEKFLVRKRWELATGLILTPVRYCCKKPSCHRPLFKHWENSHAWQDDTDTVTQQYTVHSVFSLFNILSVCLVGTEWFDPSRLCSVKENETGRIQK